MSNPLWFCLSLSLCLSPVSLPLGFPSQDIFPPKCPTHVGSMSVSSRPSPHHHHTLDALWLPLQRAAWRHQWVLLLSSQTPFLSPVVVVCSNLWFIALKHWSLWFHHFLYSGNVTINLLCGRNPCGWNLIILCPSSSHQTLWLIRRKRWSLRWTLLVGWLSYTHLNPWSPATISTARVLW